LYIDGNVVCPAREITNIPMLRGTFGPTIFPISTSSNSPSYALTKTKVKIINSVEENPNNVRRDASDKFMSHNVGIQITVELTIISHFWV